MVSLRVILSSLRTGKIFCPVNIIEMLSCGFDLKTAVIPEFIDKTLVCSDNARGGFVVRRGEPVDECFDYTQSGAVSYRLIAESFPFSSTVTSKKLSSTDHLKL